jgi:hypothetical protein
VHFSAGKTSHPGVPALNAAVDAARQKHIGETAFNWTRKNVVSNISPLVGCTNSQHGLQSKSRRSTANRSGACWCSALTIGTVTISGGPASAAPNEQVSGSGTVLFEIDDGRLETGRLAVTAQL